MSKYTVSVKFILNVTKVRCTSTYQTRAKLVFFCVNARVYEGARYQSFEKMSKYTVSVKSILNVTKVRCTSTYQTSFSSSLCRCLTLNEMYFQFSTGNNLVDGLFF